MALHSDIIAPYIHTFGTEDQKRRWLPGCASGELVTAIAMTEPGTGSDLAAIATSAKPRLFQSVRAAYRTSCRSVSTSILPPLA